MRLTTVLAVAVFALTGCSESPSDFLVRANYVCAQAAKDTRALASDHHEPAHRKPGDALRVIQRTTAELSRLTPPPVLKIRYEHYLAISKRDILLAAEAIRTRNRAAAKAFVVSIESQAGSEAAYKLGLDVCAGVAG